MTISQMSKINPVEIPKQPEIKKLEPEKADALSVEVPKVEFGQDQLIEQHRTPIQPATVDVSSALGDLGPLANQKFKKIEAILEDDLGEVYFNLSPQKQQEFKAKGEQITIKIMNLLIKPKIQVQKIMALIRDWLKIIPGINIFFLEQVVKIKTDKILDETSKKN